MVIEARELKSPSGISGFLSKAGIGFCMDGATHLIHSYHGSKRLKARNESVLKELVRYEDGTTMVTVMGFETLGPECSHLSVYSVVPADKVIELAGPIDHLP